jgi:diguanylate cyclase (GGDEF)-like protein
VQALCVVGLIVVTAAAFFTARNPLPQVDATATAHALITGGVAGLTALVLFSYGRAAGRRGFLILSATYLYVCIVTMAFPLYFPGGLVAGERVLGGFQSAPMLFVMWQYAFIVGVPWAAIVLARDIRRPALPESSTRPWLWIAGGGIAALASLFWVTVLPDTLPQILDAQGATVPWARFVAGYLYASLAVVALVITAFASRNGSIIGAWLVMVTLTMTASGIVLLNTFGRFTMGWYYTRVFSLLVSIILLVVLIARVGTIQRVNAKIAQVDQLTQVQSRARFLQTLREARREYSGGERILMRIDVNGLRFVNDQYGDRTGDLVLQQVARRIEALATGWPIGRVGGDEFGLLLPAGTSMEEAEAVAESLLSSISQPIPTDGDPVLVTATIGISSGELSENEHEVLSQADLAVTAARSHGRGSYAVYDAEVAEAARLQAIKGHKLALALRSGDDFVLWYQPFVDPATGILRGAEALVRWRRGDHYESAGSFVALAHEKKSTRLGEIVVRRLREDLPGILAASPNFFTTFNLTPWECRNDDIMETLLAPPLAQLADRIFVEVTESSDMYESGTAMDNLQRLRQAGYRLAIDDFGTGYSNLERLGFLEPELIKVDRSIVVKAGASLAGAEGPQLLEAAVRLADALGSEVVAEGVETADEHRAVLGLDVRYVQGFRYARPMPAADLIRMMTSVFVPGMRQESWARSDRPIHLEK